MTQDDAHIYCTREQMRDELTSTLQFVLDLLATTASTTSTSSCPPSNPRTSTSAPTSSGRRPPRPSRRSAEASGLDLVPDPGGAAFYGPKISVQVKDALGRTWQMSTIQLDFNLPERFDLEYTGSDGTKHRPVMIHRALFGSIERFFGVLTEHYAGAFPAWLSPVQVVGIPVAEAFGEHLDDVIEASSQPASGPRSTTPTTGCRRRSATTPPEGAVHAAGGRDGRRAGAVSFRFRDGTQINGMPVARRWIHRRLDSQPAKRLTDSGGVRLTGAACGGWRVRGAPGADGPELVRRTAIGIPDHLPRLWTPHRMAYITGGSGATGQRPRRTAHGVPVLPHPEAVGRGRADRRPG